MVIERTDPQRGDILILDRHIGMDNMLQHQIAVAGNQMRNAKCLIKRVKSLFLRGMVVSGCGIVVRLTCYGVRALRSSVTRDIAWCSRNERWSSSFVRKPTILR